jgi:molybdate transport system substrate-binding protein
LSTRLTRRAAALLLALLPFGTGAYAQSSVKVFAAASLTDSLKAVAEAYKSKTGKTVILSFDASSTLAKQIEQGAPADIFFSADTDWMDYLQQKNLIDVASRNTLLGNQLVLIGAPGSKPLAIAPHFNLAGALGDGKLALGDPASVPAGKYGKAALTALGVWDSVSASVVPAQNVRVALEYVARGEASYGIVYATDARVAPQVRVAGVFPENTHPPIIYPVALTKTAAPEARDFVAFLSGPDAQAIFEKAGFSKP